MLSLEGSRAFVLLVYLSIEFGATKSLWSVAALPASEVVVCWSVKVVKVNMPFLYFCFWRDKVIFTTLTTILWAHIWRNKDAQTIVTLYFQYVYNFLVLNTNMTLLFQYLFDKIDIKILMVLSYQF